MALSLNDLPHKRRPKKATATKSAVRKQPWQLPNFLFLGESAYELPEMTLELFESTLHGSLFEVLLETGEADISPALLREMALDIASRCISKSFRLSTLFSRGGLLSPSSGLQRFRMPVPRFFVTESKS
jgi:hypothetical protein